MAAPLPAPATPAPSEASEPAEHAPVAAGPGTETKGPPPAQEIGPQTKRSGGSVLLLAAAGLAIGVGGYHLTHRDAAAGAPDLGALPQLRVESTPAAASPSAVSADTAPTPQPAASASAADFPAAPPPPLDAPADSPKRALAAAAAASGALTQPAASGSHHVTIDTVPPKAKFFHYGKQVGTAPFVIDLPEGERRAYEVWLPGHITRKVVVDGTKSEITLGLREEPGHSSRR